MHLPAADLIQYRAATADAAWVDLTSREHLRVVGPDRVSFIHGMVTNDIAGLAEGASCPVAMLTAKGAMVGDGRVLRLGDCLIVDTGPGQRSAIKAFFEKYLISEDAELHESNEVAVVGLMGPKAHVGMVPAEAVVATMPGSLGSGLDVLIHRAQWGQVQKALDAWSSVGPTTYEVLRVEAGVPLFGVDMTQTTIPLEANLEKAIHYQKGCYIGQEVIARATYRGQMNKKLMGVLLGEHALERGAELFKSEKRVGRVTSVARSPHAKQFIALAYVHRDHLNPGTELELAAHAGVVTVSALPF